MAQFTDAQGRHWTLEINTTVLKQVQAALGLDLGKLAVAGTLYPTLADDPILLASLLAELCREEIEARRLSPEAFGRGLAGDPIDDAVQAVMEALLDFFPKGRRRVAQAAVETARQLETQAMDSAVDELESGKLRDRLHRTLESLNSATGSEGSPESIPAPSHSGN
jgi:hypothetical protein